MDLPSKLKIMIGHTPAVVERADLALDCIRYGNFRGCVVEYASCIGISNWRVNLLVAKAVLDISYVGLVNLLANREVCPELLQEEASGVLGGSVIAIRGRSTTPSNARRV